MYVFDSGLLMPFSSGCLPLVLLLQLMMLIHCSDTS
jgi:hypothetical protein